jgi:RHS repeat-associated protein
LSNVTAGTYVFTALAIDSGGSIAVSDPVVVRVDNPPAVAVTSPTADATFAPGADIQVTASASDSDEVVRKVDFFANGILVGTQVIAPYRITWTNVAPGRYSLTARATDIVGLVTTSTPVSIDVGSAPAIVITSPANGARFVAPATITVTALAGDGDGTVTRVEFFDGGALVGTATTSSGNSSYSASLKDLPAGQYTLTARAVDDQEFATVSTPVTVVVNTATAQMYYIHTDHLSTPRVIADQAGNEMWRWDNTEPFGDSAPNEDPNNTRNIFDSRLRFAGTYADSETNTLYNWYRNLDPTRDQYLQPEPLGLAGDINLYRYARNDPLDYYDPDGQVSILIPGRSTSVGISGAIPVLGPIAVGGGTGMTIRQCCSTRGQVENEWLWTVRFGVGVGTSVVPSASGRGVIPLIQVGGLPQCSPPVVDAFLNSMDASVGPISGRLGGNKILNVGLSPGGTGASIILNLFERTVVIGQKETGECCTPKAPP